LDADQVSARPASVIGLGPPDRDLPDPKGRLPGAGMHGPIVALPCPPICSTVRMRGEIMRTVAIFLISILMAGTARADEEREQLIEHLAQALAYVTGCSSYMLAKDAQQAVRPIQDDLLLGVNRDGMAMLERSS
jgi:hypothetical protein